MVQTADVAALEARFGLGSELRFREGPAGLVFADISNAQGSATICLQGAHLTTWKPASQEFPVVWVSSAAQYAPGKSIRGGVPVCWPWFGPHRGGAGFPSHGFARTVPWSVGGTRRLQDGAIEIRFDLCESGKTFEWWPHAFEVEVCLRIGTELTVELNTTNTGKQDFTIGEALHTYFRIGDVGQVQIAGLEGTEFADNAGGGRRGHQDGAIVFAGEFDRVYVNSPGACAIVDPILRRRIHITQSGAHSKVVWSPGLDKATKMGDMGPGANNQGGWREMVCVESGNALENCVAVAPGASHRMSATYRAEPWS